MHQCSGSLPSEMYGASLHACIEHEGKLWVTNGEYASQVAYCPYCGYEAPIKPEIDTDSPWPSSERLQQYQQVISEFD